MKFSGAGSITATSSMTCSIFCICQILKRYIMSRVMIILLKTCFWDPFIRWYVLDLHLWAFSQSKTNGRAPNIRASTACCRPPIDFLIFIFVRLFVFLNSWFLFILLINLSFQPKYWNPAQTWNGITYIEQEFMLFLSVCNWPVWRNDVFAYLKFLIYEIIRW